MERDIPPLLQPPTEEEQHTTGGNNNNGDDFRTDDERLASLKSMLEIEWYMNNMPTHNEQVVPNFQIQTQQQNNFVSSSNPNSYVVVQPLGSSSFSPPSNFHFSHLLNVEGNINNIISTSTTNNNEGNNNNSFGSVFCLESQKDCLTPFQGDQKDLPAQNGYVSQFPKTSVVGFAPIGLKEGISFGDGSGSSSSMFLSNDKISKPLESHSPILAPPDLLDNKDTGSNVSETNKLGPLSIPQFTSTWLKEFDHKLQIVVIGEVDGGLNCESKKGVDIGGNDDVNDDEDENGVGEMDKASIIGDAIDYLNELQQNVDDLQSELESISLGSSLAPTTSTLHVQVNGELCHSNVPSARNQSIKVEAWEIEEGTVNIHMVCAYKPGVLLSVMKAFEILGLDIHQANINCFYGFTIDIYNAKQCRQGQKVNTQLIKEVLVNAVDYHMA
ncbi:hypothetical protein RYX36_013595 [Vicia faba]